MTNKTIKQQLAELDQIIEWFNNSDEFEIETATEKYKQASELMQAIKKDLDEKQNQITELK